MSNGKSNITSYTCEPIPKLICPICNEPIPYPYFEYHEECYIRKICREEIEKYMNDKEKK